MNPTKNYNNHNKNNKAEKLKYHNNYKANLFLTIFNHL